MFDTSYSRSDQQLSQNPESIFTLAILVLLLVCCYLGFKSYREIRLITYGKEATAKVISIDVVTYKGRSSNKKRVRYHFTNDQGKVLKGNWETYRSKADQYKIGHEIQILYIQSRFLTTRPKDQIDYRTLTAFVSCFVVFFALILFVWIKFNTSHPKR
ncbi:MAG: hypothetical protein MK193_04845 [Lentisphaeria bacterium]|nr:hypothetical protein [Lentisphaeria bacterium]